MKTTKDQKEAFAHLEVIRKCIATGSHEERLKAIQDLAEVYGILCGLKGLDAAIKEIEKELDMLRGE